MSLILLIAALICFVLKALNVAVSVDLIALGLAFWVGSTLV